MKRRPNAKFYLLDPRSIWNLWKMLHVYTGFKIRQNPPSSGFIGLFSWVALITIRLNWNCKCGKRTWGNSNHTEHFCCVH